LGASGKAGKKKRTRTCVQSLRKVEQKAGKSSKRDTKALGGEERSSGEELLQLGGVELSLL